MATVTASTTKKTKAALAWTDGGAAPRGRGRGGASATRAYIPVFAWSRVNRALGCPGRTPPWHTGRRGGGGRKRPPWGSEEGAGRAGGLPAWPRPGRTGPSCGPAWRARRARAKGWPHRRSCRARANRRWATAASRMCGRGVGGADLAGSGRLVATFPAPAPPATCLGGPSRLGRARRGLCTVRGGLWLAWASSDFGLGCATSSRGIPEKGAHWRAADRKGATVGGN